MVLYWSQKEVAYRLSAPSKKPSYVLNTQQRMYFEEVERRFLFFKRFAYLHMCKYKGIVDHPSSIHKLVVSNHRTDLNQTFRNGSLGLEDSLVPVVFQNIPFLPDYKYPG